MEKIIENLRSNVELAEYIKGVNSASVNPAAMAI